MKDNSSNTPYQVGYQPLTASVPLTKSCLALHHRREKPNNRFTDGFIRATVFLIYNTPIKNNRTVVTPLRRIRASPPNLFRQGDQQPSQALHDLPRLESQSKLGQAPHHNSHFLAGASLAPVSIPSTVLTPGSTFTKVCAYRRNGSFTP